MSAWMFDESQMHRVVAAIKKASPDGVMPPLQSDDTALGRQLLGLNASALMQRYSDPASLFGWCADYVSERVEVTDVQASSRAQAFPERRGTRLHVGQHLFEDADRRVRRWWCGVRRQECQVDQLAQLDGEGGDETQSREKQVEDLTFSLTSLV